MKFSRRTLVALCLAVLPPAVFAGGEPLRVAGARASTSVAGSEAARAVDGDRSARSRWRSDGAAVPQWLEIELAAPTALAGLHLFSGANGVAALRDFTVQFERDGRWVDVPSATVTGNIRAELELRFDDTVPVFTRKLRLWITDTGGDQARVGEVVVWPLSAGGVPAIPRRADQEAPVELFLNQSGFSAGEPKRFTAPGLADGTRFEVRPAGATAGAAVFAGEIRGQAGDFSAFEPGDARDYVIAAGGRVSVPFRVGQWWLERVTYQGAVDFMIDSRHYVGNERAVCRGSYGWRDDHHFGWQLHTLVPQWISNPSAYARMPRQVAYEAPADPKLWGKLEPPRPEAPDLVKLIHWGADIIVTQGTTHELMKSQLAYFLYAWPALADYLPEQNYRVVRDFAFSVWGQAKADHKYPYDESPEHDLFALKTRLGGTKGAYPPGFSVQPNLLMHEVAKREGRADAGRYLEAAVRQAEWMVANLDWEDPQTTKGQRMSEFITMTGLAHLLEGYPGRAPAGLREKIEAWAAVVIRRSANLWDFRKLGDAPDSWTPMGTAPTMWNEPGNVAGLPAAIMAALPHIADAAKAERLRQIAWAQVDSVFGRNPTGRHFSYAAAREIEGVEHGWYHRHIGGIGKLEKARFVLDGSPKNAHFPFRPEVGDIGWTEGWIQHNTPFNLSLAYLARARTALSLARDGDEWVVTLVAPLNFDPAKVETGEVLVTDGAGGRHRVAVTENSPNSRALTGRVRLPRAAGEVRASYGHGYLGRETAVAVAPAVTAVAPELDLGGGVQPLPPGARFSEPGFFVWCGAPIRGEDGKYHLLYSRWPERAGFHPGWALRSEIAYAVSDGPFGPFRPVNVALPARGVDPATGKKFWDGDATHNPNVIRHPDGKYYLYYMGNHGDGRDYPTHRNNQRVGVAVAEHPAGPWTRFDAPVVDVSSDAAAFDSLCVTNPAAVVRPDGSVLLIYKAVAREPGQVMGGKVRYGAAIAARPTGPFVKTPGRIFEAENPAAAKHWMLAEDPFVWFSRTHGARYYAVARDVVGEFTGEAGGIALFESGDGLHWRAAKHAKVIGAHYALADGTLSATKLERPAVLLDGDEPVALFGAADGYRTGGRISTNVAIPLRP
jgi:hypothetical protein